MSIFFASLKHINLPTSIKIPITIWQIVYIYVRVLSPNLISCLLLLLYFTFMKYSFTKLVGPWLLSFCYRIFAQVSLFVASPMLKTFIKDTK